MCAQNVPARHAEFNRKLTNFVARYFTINYYFFQSRSEQKMYNKSELCGRVLLRLFLNIHIRFNNFVYSAFKILSST